MTKKSKAPVPAPQHIELTFVNKENGNASLYYKEITTVGSIELAKIATANTSKVNSMFKDSDTKIYRKGVNIYGVTTTYGDVDQIIFGLLLEFMAQSADRKSINNLLAKMIKGVLTKKQIAELKKFAKEHATSII